MPHRGPYQTVPLVALGFSSPLDHGSATLLELGHIPQNSTPISVVHVRKRRRDHKRPIPRLGVGMGHKVVDVANRVGQVEPGRQPRAAGHLDAERDDRLRHVDVAWLRGSCGRRGRGRRGRGGGRGSGVAIARHGTSQPSSLATKGSVDTRQPAPGFVMGVDAGIDGLILPDVHEVQGSTPCADHTKCSVVSGVIEAVERAVVDAEAILPQVNGSLLHLLGTGRLLLLLGPSWMCPRIGNSSTVDAIAPNCLAGTPASGGPALGLPAAFTSTAGVPVPS
jgi:hypothetical protein